MNLRTAIGCVGSALVLCVGAQALCAAPPPEVSWATKAGGTGSGLGSDVSALPDGSSIVTGRFYGIATFGSTTLTSDGGASSDAGAGSDNVFTAKMNADGTWAWATKAAHPERDVGMGLGVSALPDGSSIVTGYFSGSATFGSTTLIGDVYGDVFIAKMNADGTWAWATGAGGGSYDMGFGVSSLPDGSSIVTGYFSGTATFGTTTLTSSEWNSAGMFTAKLNADGTWAWATQAGGTGFGEGYGVSALPDGSSIVTGVFGGGGTATFGSTTLSTDGTNAVFTAKMNADGTWAWATKADGTGDNSGQGISALHDGSSIVTGYFEDTATFGSTTLTSAENYGNVNGYGVFTAKMNADGTWAWATQAGGTGSGRGMGVSALPDGSSIVTGYFGGTATFGSTSLTNSENVCSYGSCATGFTAKMNADGTWAWATQAGGTGFGEGSGVSALPDGSSIATGFFSGLAIFGSTTLEGSGGTCGTFMSMYSCRDVLTVRYLDAPQAPAAPVAVAGDASAAVTITPLAGGSVTSYTVTSSPDAKTCTVAAPLTSCTVASLTNRTSYTFAATATNAAGTGAASPSSNAVTPAATAAAAAVVIKGKVHCVATTCVTTGSVPAGATRITQRATTRPSGRSATGKCAIRRTKAKRTYSCTVQLSRGTWVITTTARTQSAAMAHFSKRVQVAPRKAAVTG